MKCCTVVHSYVNYSQYNYSKQSIFCFYYKHIKNTKVIQLEQIDNEFLEAVQHIQRQSMIGVAAEGINMSRIGKMCWLQVLADATVYLFDILALGREAFEQGLRSVFQSEMLLKVVHDCRAIADILHHVYNVKMVNVFDTQVAEVMVYRMDYGGNLPRYVKSLSSCLQKYLNLSNDEISFDRVCQFFSNKDQSEFAKRPLPDHIRIILVRHVMYLLELRYVMMECMLKEFVFGVNIFLDDIKNAPDQDISCHLGNRHRLPNKFAELNDRAVNSNCIRKHNKNSTIADVDENGFIENCLVSNDPEIIFSKDIWHSKTKDNQTGTVKKSVTEIPERFQESEVKELEVNNKIILKPAGMLCSVTRKQKSRTSL